MAQRMSSIPGPPIRTAFGEGLTAQLVPMAGWKFAYNINPEMVKVTVANGGAVTESNGRAVLTTAAAVNSSAKIETLNSLRYMPGFGGMGRFTATFAPPELGSVQMIGIGDEEADGFFVGYNGVSWGLCRERAGVATWIYPEDFNGNGGGLAAGLLDWEKGNIFQIQYQWLGYGAIRWWAEDPMTGEFRMLHMERYANTSAETSVINPTLPLMAMVANSTNDSAMALRTPSALAAQEGCGGLPMAINPFTLFRTVLAAKSGITTETNVLTLRNPATYFGRANRMRLRLTALSVHGEGVASNAVNVFVKVGATLGGEPSFTPYGEAVSPAETDTAGTTVTGGTLRFAGKIGRNVGVALDLAAWGIEVGPGETATVSVSSASAIAPEVALSWADQF